MSTDTGQPSGITEDIASGDQRRDRMIRRILLGATSITVLTTIAIFAVLFDNTWGFFFDATFSEWVSTSILNLGMDGLTQRVTFTEFFTDSQWRPSHADDPRFGIPTLISATILITVGAAFVSIPIGTAAALYLSEYAGTRTRKYLKPTLEVLAGVPTIVYGFFAVSFVTPVLLRPVLEVFGLSVGRNNALAGMVVVGIMTIPMVASISEDAMNSVPDELRNGAYALGASKYKVSASVVLPASISGVFASYILAVSRAIGETMAVTLAAGATPNLTANPLAEVQTMTAYMVTSARSTALVGSVTYQSLFAVGLVLFLMTLAANLVNDYIKRRYREVYQ
ncbi:phosphate ABC transporter permease subunit PstC [Halalkalicoccus tibetensis]|uniref:Phosphate transport system permease protein n=1 Tax=Halalkalicoccus tibetensis TaxID=175632 RepID=A0ABD5V4H2_9EURY